MKIDLTEKQILAVMVGLAVITGTEDPDYTPDLIRSAVAVGAKLGFKAGEYGNFERI